MAETITEFKVPDKYERLGVAALELLADRAWNDVYDGCLTDKGHRPTLMELLFEAELNLIYTELRATLAAKRGNHNGANRWQAECMQPICETLTEVKRIAGI